MSRSRYGYGYGSIEPRRRPRPRMTQRVGPHPDRFAAWAVALGIVMMVAAILSAH